MCFHPPCSPKGAQSNTSPLLNKKVPRGEAGERPGQGRDANSSQLINNLSKLGGLNHHVISSFHVEHKVAPGKVRELVVSLG